MANTNICILFECPYWSEGVKGPQGSIGGYGCQKFDVAPHCIVSEVSGVTATEYALYYETGESNGNKKNLIKMTIASLTEQKP